MCFKALLPVGVRVKVSIHLGGLVFYKQRGRRVQAQGVFHFSFCFLVHKFLVREVLGLFPFCVLLVGVGLGVARLRGVWRVFFLWGASGRIGLSQSRSDCANTAY